ncbi:MAG: regulatory protein LuxR [Caulobacteraceae bacterium]|jgi:two-component system nitrate/nitrite response regulator NarL|nr:regulatory protein LuxR [Caulobacteraceae bacterium]
MRNERGGKLPKTRLFILGAVRLHREGLALQLAGAGSLEVVGTGGLNDAVRTLRSTPADVALLDTFQLDIAKVVESLRGVLRRVRVIAMGVREVESEVLACAAAGVDGYVRTEANVEEVVTVVESVMRGELVVSPKVAASLYHSVASLGTDDEVALTSRELQVVELMSHGLSNKEISNRLSIEPCTAKNHVQNIMQKLGVHRRGEAVAKLRRSIGQHFR